MTVNPFFQKNSILASIQKTLYWKQTPLSIFLCVQDKKIETSHFSFFPLEYPQQKRKSPVKSLGGALHSLLGFLFSVSSCKRKKITRPHHQNGYSLILPVTVPYPLLSSDLSFSRLDKVSYIYVPLCFPQTYPYCINHHSGLVIFETSNAG